MYTVYFFNSIALYGGKFTLITFFYEVLPTRLRKTLHLATAFVASAFLVSILATAFWCMPHSRMWQPQFGRGPDFCAPRLLPNYNLTMFCAHITSTVAVSVLPMVLLRWIPGGTKEAAFAFSVMGFGAVAILASSIAYLCIVKLQTLSLDPNLKHSAVIGIVADQNAIFWAASMSVFRVRRLVKEEPSPRPDGGKSLVIKVEKRYSVTVEIVREWGHGWNDPWERGRVGDSQIRMDGL